MSSGDSEGRGEGQGQGRDEKGEELVTAIFRPESNEDWKEQLREAGRRAYTSSSSALNGGGASGGDQELENLEWDMGDAEEKGQKKESKLGIEGAESEQVWKCKKTLKGHLDAVRATRVFGDEVGFEVVSGGDDFVVKMWRQVLAHKS